MSDFEIFNEDFLSEIDRIEDNTVDLVIADPPYGLGKDYGNSSDKLDPGKHLKWTENWINKIIPKIKQSGSMYVFTTWRYSPEIFCALKKKMTMKNEIIWDRKVPSMGGSTRSFSSVHDTIGFFVKSNDYYFDIDSVRIPYDEKTKKARTRSIFIGKKWLEIGCNPKDVWRVSRLHRLHSEREDHPTQKPLVVIERMIKASCPRGGLVLDPFAGSGTTMEACMKHDRRCVSYEINPVYCEIIKRRILNLEYAINGLSHPEISKQPENDAAVGANSRICAKRESVFKQSVPIKTAPGLFAQSMLRQVRVIEDEKT